MKRIIAIVLTVAMLSFLAGCGNSDTPKVTDATTTVTDSIIENDSLNLADYRLTYSAGISKTAQDGLSSFKKAIREYTGVDMPSDHDRRNNEEDSEGVKEILVGKTNRKETQEALELLKGAGADSYIIMNSGDKIVIAGENDTDLLFAMNAFLTTFVSNSKEGAFVMEDDFRLIGSHDEETQILPSLVTVRTEFVSIIEGNGKKWPTYGRLLQLKYNGENNGVMFATSQWAGNSFPLYRSTDGGKNWELMTTISEQIKPALSGNWQPEIYELPVDVGLMPKGTLLLGGCTHNDTISRICLWRSFDLGETWEEFTVIDHAGGAGQKNGMWEPFMICDEDGKLVVFYSDETDVNEYGGQRLVFRVSVNGEEWGEKQYCVAPKDKKLRPGMVSVAKMGDEGYLIVYEMIGESGGPVYYKTSDSLTNWDYESKGKKLYGPDGEFTGCTPYCVWTPAGGPHGTVVACGRFGKASSPKTQSKIFLSNDLGKTWRTIDNPLVWDYLESKDSNPNYADSLGFMVDSDGAVYHIANCFPNDESQKYIYSNLMVCKIIIS